MDHSAMDHSAMHGLESPTPSPAASAMHQGHMMSMQMWFQATEKVVLWFKEWKVSTHAEYAASIIGLVFLCLLQESISRLRMSIIRRNGHRIGAADAENAAVVHPESGSPPYFGRLRNFYYIRGVLSILYALNLTTSYLLMLAVMTYNVGFFVAIICGLALGHLIFFPAAASKGASTSFC